MWVKNCPLFCLNPLRSIFSKNSPKISVLSSELPTSLNDIDSNQNIQWPEHNDLLLTEEEVQLTLGKFRQEFQQKQREVAQRKAQEAAAAEQSYLVASSQKEGVVSLPSGLQYKVVRPGDGPSPLKTDKVKVHYRGTLTDGTVFDSSYDRGQPISFNVSGVIKGWTEALLLMQVGAKWELTIPSGLGYGARGGGAKIPPNSTLLFEVELLEIE